MKGHGTEMREKYRVKEEVDKGPRDRMREKYRVKEEVGEGPRDRNEGYKEATRNTD